MVAMRKRAPRLAFALLFVLALWQLPRCWMQRPAAGWWRGEADVQRRLARANEDALARRLDEGHFATADPRFDGEWLFASYMMAALGYGQIAAEHPQLREHYTAAMDRAIDRLIEPELRAFDTAAWNADALANLDRPQAHVAFLGYLDLVLSMRSWLGPGGRHETLNARITAALRRRFEAAPGRLLFTYPGEIYPVDNASAIAAIALHARAHGKPPPRIVRQWIERVQDGIVDPRSGLLIQSVSDSGQPIDEPRASGSALAAYFMSFADEAFARELFTAVKNQIERPLGFAAVQEYPDSRWRLGDIDSGPLVLGYSVSATGFMLGAARALDDRETFTSLVATVSLVGGPRFRQGRQRFAAGGALGDALMLALLTAQPAALWADKPPLSVAPKSTVSSAAAPSDGVEEGW